MMFSIVGCADNNNNSLPIIPDSSNMGGLGVSPYTTLNKILAV